MPLEASMPSLEHTPPSRALGLGDATFDRIAGLVRTECGIELSQSKSNLIVSRLGRRVKTLNLITFDAYVDHIETPSGRDELRRMISLLTTNVTKFFREPHHFAALRADILPKLIAKARSGASVRIWSAGCSSGEEPLSIGMETLKLCPQASDLDLRILGTDLDPVSLQTARRASYDASSISNLTTQDQGQFFEPADDGKNLRAISELRDLITYAELNLIGEWPMERPFDVIFCRNVVIYFDNPTQATLWPRFANALHRKGSLFIGHSERLGGPGVSSFEPSGITQYRRI
ncbi:MAG: protein-glutamate O-methyltransferase [Pseudomonadota bacterium]